MTNTNNKISFKNVLIFVFGILSIFITAFFAPIVQTKVHKLIVANAEEYNHSGEMRLLNKMLEQDELAGTWVFNDSLTNVSSTETNVNFTSSNTDFIGIKTESVLGPGPSEIYMWYKNSDNSNTMAFVSTIGERDIWKDEAYKTITITSKLSEVTNGDELLAWLQANATKQQPTPTPTAYSVTYTLNNCTSDSTNPTALYSNTDYTFKFNITNLDYDVTFVTVGNATLVNYTSSNGVIIANINNVVGNVTFDVSVATQTTFTITYNFGEGVLGNDNLPMTIKNGEIVSGDVSTMATYQFDSITATNGYLELTYNDTRTSVNFELSGVTANTEIVFTAKIPTDSIVGGKYKSSLPSGRLPLNNGIGYENDELYTITTSFDSYNGFDTLHFVSFNMRFLDYPTLGYTTCTAYFLDSYGQYYHLFEGNDNTWYNNYLKYITCNTSVTTSQIASKGFYYIYKSTVYDSYILDSGIYTFKLNNDYYSSSFMQTLPFVYWNGTDFNSTPQSKIVVKNGLYYLSSLNTETIVYGADSYLNNNARCIKVLQSISMSPYVYDTLISMLDTGNQIGYYIGGSYTFTFDNLNNKDTSLFTNFNFQYFKDNYYSDYINVKGFEVVSSKLYYILFDNTKVLVYNGSWVADYYRYISIVYQNVSSAQLDYLNTNGVFKNLYVGGNVSTWQQFFFTIADVPLYIFSRIFYFELFGEQTFIIIYSIITILIVFKIVSWALKLKD